MWLLTSQDPAVPHRVGFLADESQLRDDSLKFSELWCAMFLSLSRHTQRAYAEHQTIPVSQNHLADCDKYTRHESLYLRDIISREHD